MTLSCAAAVADVDTLPAALQACADACERLEQLAVGSIIPEITRHAEVFAKCRQRCHDALGIDALLRPSVRDDLST